MTDLSKSSATAISPARLEGILAKLGFHKPPEPSLEGLRDLYGKWCLRVPFDNVQKILHLRSGADAPLAGSTAESFFQAWLTHGTGGTCWSGAGALCDLLTSLGFVADRGIATMLVAPDLPPNHGTVRVRFDHEQYLVDSSILSGEPLRLDSQRETIIEDPAWGVRCAPSGQRWHITWRPLHKPEGFSCRIESFGATSIDYQIRYEATRGWSPFNYEVTARINKAEGQEHRVVGVSFGKAVVLRGDGSVEQRDADSNERNRILIEEIGLSEECVLRLPDDVPTPPPPSHHKAPAA